jgi:hypothetical protein
MTNRLLSALMPSSPKAVELARNSKRFAGKVFKVLGLQFALRGIQNAS